MPAQRYSTRGVGSTSSARNESRAPWISSVVTSSRAKTGPELRACLGGGRGEATHEPRWLHGAVADVVDGAPKVRGQQQRQLVAPLARKAVVAQRLELRADLVPLLLVGGKP